MRQLPPLEIRRANASDATVLTEFNRRLAWETEQLELDVATLSAGVLGVINQPQRGFYLMAARDGTAIGSLMVTYEWSDWRNANFWWLQSVYVTVEARGSGIFRALHQRVKELAREEGACGIRLYVERANDVAQSVYRRSGFSPTNYRMFEGPVA